MIGLFAASALFLTTLSAPVFAEDPSETGAEEPAVSISINDFTEPHPLPTPDPDYVEISLEEYLERLANGEIFEDPSGNEKELALYASTGWEQVSGKWKYKVDGVYVVNAWKFINNNWYYFDGSGYMKTGWFRDQGNWYYLTTAADGGTEGAMTIGWKKLSGHWYYFNGSGVMQTDWVTIGENQYYFSPSESGTSSPSGGHMYHGMRMVGPKYYYFGFPGQQDSGAMIVNNWVKDSEQTGTPWYYAEEDGALASGWRVINNRDYYFDTSTRKMRTGQVTISGTTYYFNNDSTSATYGPASNQSYFSVTLLGTHDTDVRTKIIKEAKTLGYQRPYTAACITPQTLLQRMPNYNLLMIHGYGNAGLIACHDTNEKAYGYLYAVSSNPGYTSNDAAIENLQAQSLSQVELAILMCCNGSDKENAYNNISVADSLRSKGVKATQGWKYTISNANGYALLFLKELESGYTIMEAALNAIKDLKNQTGADEGFNLLVEGETNQILSFPR